MRESGWKVKVLTNILQISSSLQRALMWIVLQIGCCNIEVQRKCADDLADTTRQCGRHSLKSQWIYNNTFALVVLVQMSARLHTD